MRAFSSFMSSMAMSFNSRWVGVARAAWGPRGGNGEPSGRDRQGVAADAAVARAELVGLQAVEDPQHLLGAAPDVEVVDRHVLDDVVRVDDERCAKRHPFVRIAHAELVDERAPGIAELPLRQLVEILVL